MIDARTTPVPERAPIHACVAAILLGTLVYATGCVDRRIAITSEPPGALVHLNDQEVGRTPLEVNFEWFGTYDVRLTLDGYEPITTSREAEPPLHEQPGIDLIALAMPMTSRTRIAWHFELQPAEMDQASLIERGMELGRRLNETQPDPSRSDENQRNEAQPNE